MAEPSVMDLKNCTVKFKDGATPTPNSLTLYIDEGNLTYRVRREIEYKLNRGSLTGAAVREGDEQPMELTISCRFNAIRSSAGDPVTVQEFLYREGQASAYVTTGAECEPYAVDVVVEINYSCGTVVDEVVTFPDFRYEDVGGDFRAGTLELTGRCQAVKPTSVRSNLS